MQLVARVLAPARLCSDPKPFGPAAQSSGSKLLRHRGLSEAFDYTVYQQ